MIDSRSWPEMRWSRMGFQDPGLRRKGALARFKIDERDPTADRRLIEFGFRLPASAQLDNGIARPVARRALADLLPGEVLDNRVRGLQSADWISLFSARSALSLIEEMSSCSAVQELFDLPGLKAACENWPDPDSLSPAAMNILGQEVMDALNCGMFMTFASRYPERLGRPV